MNPSAPGTLQYMPMLKWKMGEQSALQRLPEELRARMLPLAELPDRPIDWNSEAEEPVKSWDDHLAALCRATVNRWGRTFELAIDQAITDADTTEDGKPAWRALFKTLWHEQVKAVPVL